MTSRRSPISVTAATRSSSAHGESSELTRVQNWRVGRASTPVPISTSPARAASLSLAGMPSSRLASSTSTVGAISATLATILGLYGGRKWIIRDGRNGISRTGSGAPTASGRKKSLGGRIGPSAYGPAPAASLNRLGERGQGRRSWGRRRRRGGRRRARRRRRPGTRRRRPGRSARAWRTRPRACRTLPSKRRLLRC